MAQPDNRALLFDIQRYSLHDGPGIRTLVFLKGCPLRCLWCCNPESQQPAPEVAFHADLCTGCGRCAAACPQGAVGTDNPGGWKIDKARCQNCGACAGACPTGALRVIGRWADVPEVLAEVEKDLRYYRRSGGGITLSGGEPLIWPGFCAELLEACYERNIHTAVETTGCLPAETFERVQDHVDLFLYDIKSMDSARHHTLTGLPNGAALDNLRRLRRAGKQVVMRVPLIPGPQGNFTRAELEGMFALAEELGITEVNLMPYHDLGAAKYQRLCRPYPLDGLPSLKFAADLEARLAAVSDIFGRHGGITVGIGG